RGATYRNLLLTMTLGGLWHGAAWHFALWGAYQGLGLAGLRWLGERRARLPARLGTVLATALTFHFVCLGWVLFRAANLPVAGVDRLVDASVGALIAADPGRSGSSPAWRLALYHRAPPPDVLLIGSSRVQTGLDPALLRQAVAPALGRAPTILNLGIAWS